MRLKSGETVKTETKLANKNTPMRPSRAREPRVWSFFSLALRVLISFGFYSPLKPFSHPPIVSIQSLSVSHPPIVSISSFSVFQSSFVNLRPFFVSLRDPKTYHITAPNDLFITSTSITPTPTSAPAPPAPTRAFAALHINATPATPAPQATQAAHQTLTASRSPRRGAAREVGTKHRSGVPVRSVQASPKLRPSPRRTLEQVPAHPCSLPGPRVRDRLHADAFLRGERFCCPNHNAVSQAMFRCAASAAKTGTGTRPYRVPVPRFSRPPGFPQHRTHANTVLRPLCIAGHVSLRSERRENRYRHAEIALPVPVFRSGCAWLRSAMACGLRIRAWRK